MPHPAVDIDGRNQIVFGRRVRRDLAEILQQGAQLPLPEGDAELGVALVREIEITDILIGKEQLPHPREVADDIAGRGEECRRQKVQPPRLGKLDHRSRQMTDIALVKGVAADDLQLVTAAVDPDRQHAAGVDDLARRVHRQVSGGRPTALGLEPFPRDPEIEIVVTPKRPVDDVTSGAHTLQSIIRGCFLPAAQIIQVQKG